MTKRNSGHNQVENVALIFNEMVGEYDNLCDLWYRYTFGSIDEVLLSNFPLLRNANPKPIALDIGCGTGIQSLRLMGYKVIGVDIADELLKVARKKLLKAGYIDAEFYNIDAQSLPFSDNIADCVNCCGPTLSFIPDWRKALSEMARCLKLGGKLLLEVEGKWNFDLFWEIVNGFGCNFLEYDEPLFTALSHLLPPWDKGHIINYSFKLESGQTVPMRLKLFSAKELTRELQKVGLIIEKRWGLHVLTNLIPSTILHKPNPSRPLQKLFNRLASIEKRFNRFWPFSSFGCSLLVLACKVEQKTKQKGGPDG